MNSWHLKAIELANDCEPLRPGDRVELGFCLGRNIVSEHLWVRVFARIHHGAVYFASLESDAKTIDGLTKGDQVKFKPEHVVRVRRRSW